MLIRWIGSICTATFRLMISFARGLKANKTLTVYRDNVAGIRVLPEIRPVTLPKLSIAAKLYAICAAMAIASAALCGSVHWLGSTTLSAISGTALFVTIVSAILLVRSIAAPLRQLADTTAILAAGDQAVAIPFGERPDEIGALARSIGVFQQAMRDNDELNRTVVEDAETRAKRQEQMSGEIARFSAEVEAT